MSYGERSCAEYGSCQHLHQHKGLMCSVNCPFYKWDKESAKDTLVDVHEALHNQKIITEKKGRD